MTNESLLNEDWAGIVARLGGAERLDATARETKAFVRPRQISNAVDLLRLILAYCLGERGLRATAAWAASVGLVDVSNVAVLYRLRQCGDWLDRKSTRLNSSHANISYAVFCLIKKHLPTSYRRKEVSASRVSGSRDWLACPSLMRRWLSFGASKCWTTGAMSCAIACFGVHFAG